MWRELAKIDDEQLKKAADDIRKMEEETAKAAIEAKNAAAEATEKEQERLRKAYEDAGTAQINAIKERLNQIYGNAAEAAKIELEAAQTAYGSLLQMDAATKAALFDNEEQYKGAVLDAEAAMLEARQKNAEAMKAQTEEVSNTVKAMTGALNDLFEAAAGDSEEYEKFRKAIAIVDATITLAQTIAAATAVSTEGDPYTMAIRIAANVAAVTAQFAAVLKAIKSAQVPSSPGFAHGGIVEGNSTKGDKVTARLNSREMVLTLEQQQHLFDLITQGIPAATIDYDRMAAAFARAASELPAPVMEYSEYKTFKRNVRFAENKSLVTNKL
jgi:hypothetical protein